MQSQQPVANSNTATELVKKKKGEKKLHRGTRAHTHIVLSVSGAATDKAQNLRDGSSKRRQENHVIRQEPQTLQG
ncbi:hypothetical protein Ngar_c07780 [Candidatus Nitrososphaera gargensis Ga9.2]|uniref:Uncharacterized protein n=1 Tax=Nitrososphaera gargensis (strain Ga9.2) TaxID=1237085 RepID=K0IDI8_NITGG|nr:hypothetical protein [Candidatus Nitrososphaera gargensis]AFU57720.1 hypothetical protein Ngar_c07780 [Candidatus Nitrososphaera gargensis Ga9.2]